ncbi:putative NRPS-like protein biosynthetic cluster [Myotisia sp. PD_48]|nr:putative NRPS-like protein biosynthetic cluster [Myotisia sp. PD_48]
MMQSAMNPLATVEVQPHNPKSIHPYLHNSTTKASKTPSTGFTQASIHLQSSQDIKDQILTVPQLVEFNAKQNAHHFFCIQTQKTGQPAAEQLLHITHGQLKNAVLGCQEWLLDNINELHSPYVGNDGKLKKNSPVALFMESDIGLLVHLLALMGLGVPVVLLSARLSPIAVHHLLDRTNTGAIVLAPRLQNTVRESLALFPDDKIKPAQHVNVHYETFLLSVDGYGHAGKKICHPNHYVNETDTSVLILHSSGTTGLPKPISQPHRWFLAFTANYQFNGADEAQGSLLTTLPLYHAAGLVAPSLAMGAGKTVVLPPSSTVSTGTSTLALLGLTKAKSLMTVPSILEEITLLPGNQGVLLLQSLQFVAFGGGRLKPSIGQKLNEDGVKLLNHYGSTETGSLSIVFVPGTDYDWRYFRLRKDIKLTIEPAESVFGSSQHYKLVTWPFGWNKPFEIQDQLVSDPGIPPTDFRTVGRNDDLIVLATGKKVFPGPLESMLSETANVKAAIAFGDGQFELGVIVEPSVPVLLGEVEEFKSAIWPVIMAAGDRMDAHARITSKDSIVVAVHGKLLPRSDKGSIMRREAYTIFESEIAEAYIRLDNPEANEFAPRLSLNNLEQDLKQLIETELNWKIPPDQWDITDDLFELGMDSLQALRLRRLLIRSLSATEESTSWAEYISRGFVYLHPSVAELARALRHEQVPSGIVRGRDELIDQLVSQFSLPAHDLPTKIQVQPHRNIDGHGIVVLLTGSTGSLGSHVLSYLACLEEVTRVVCLNRVHVEESSSNNAYTRQLQSLRTRGIAIPTRSWQKIVIFETNMSAPLFGLDEAEYTTLSQSVTHILHCAWPMDFKRQVSSFKTQFQTIQNFLLFCREIHMAQPSIKPVISFVSSIAVVGRYPDVYGERIVPEEPVIDTKSTNPFGYAEAKLVCERILENAAARYSDEITVKCVRCGQITGSKQNSVWNITEYFPALVKSAQMVGVLPSIEGTVSWLPADICAQTISEITISTEKTNITYHVENPIRQPWHDILSIIATELNIPDNNRVPLPKWLDRVDSIPDTLSDEIPAKKLMEFFRGEFQRLVGGTVILDTYRSRGLSTALKSVNELDRDTILGYIKYWKQIQFLK